MWSWATVAVVLVLLSPQLSCAAEPDQVKHSGHGPAPFPGHKDNGGSVAAPLQVNCSKPVCDGPLASIYCIGDILTTSWQLGMQDSCPGERLKKKPDEVLANFKNLSYPITAEVFKQFCDDNFERTHWLDNATFHDWIPDPEPLANITKPDLKRLALEIHRRWNILGRKFKDDVVANPLLYPVTIVPHPFVVPGGDFGIYFYWDSFWALRGLLISNMTDTSRNMIDNFVHLINTKGFIPNSGKLQLSSRTQPPLFAQMLYDYWTITADANYTRIALDAAEKELGFWETQRMRTVKRGDKTFTIFQYRAPSNCPRPENFLLDYYQGINSTRTPESIWQSTASACESGWDFSSRWFAHNGSDAYDKKSIHTSEMVPLDLNVFMAWNYRALMRMHKALNNSAKADQFRAKFQAQTSLVADFFWDESEGIWFDYDLETGDFQRSFYATNVLPFLILRPNGEVIKRVVEYLEKNKVFAIPGGIPTTLPVPSTEQWDFPNVWAPSMHLWVLSLLMSRDAYLTEKAKEGADKFIQSVYNGVFFPPDGKPAGIWEKYDARKNDGSHGGGGEYPVQEGFAWTNGAVLDLIMMFEQPAEWGIQQRYLSVDDSGPSPSFMEGEEFFGGFPHSIIVLSLIALCLLIGIFFTLMSMKNLKRQAVRRCMRQRDGDGESTQSTRLLDDTDDQ